MKPFVTVVFLFLFAILISTGVLAQESEPTSTPDGSRSPLVVEDVSRPTYGFDDTVKVYHHAGTGKVRFLVTEPGRPIRQPTALSPNASPEAAARNFLNTYGELFGLKDPSQELILERIQTAEPRQSFLRFQQVHQGIPVIGGELIVGLDADNQITSANGEILPDLSLETSPRLAAQEAAQTALEWVSEFYPEIAGGLQGSEPQLWIYNPVLLGAQGLPGDRLVWRLEVTAGATQPIREFVLVDAIYGNVVLNFNQVDSLRERIIYDNNNDNTLGLPGSGPVREEGGAATGISDVDNAYDYAGFTYDYYNAIHGRDSIDGNGMELVSTVRFCNPSYPCPYQNAFWDGSQMVYGEGYASSDDVVGHELTHGVTEHESGLYYYMQSGAINEALSDIWGEFIDLSYTNGLDDDTAGVRWLMGEDIPGGAIRSMSDPTAFGDPDRIGSPNYYCGINDRGGVHWNSGVANKAAYLMADGGTFNGYNITGIGLAKTAHIWYYVQTNLLTSGSDYQDLGLGLSQACSSLVGSYGITSTDCQQVREAVAATEMHLQPASCDASDAPLCDKLGFNSQFNQGMTGWSPISGNWAISGGYLSTAGDPNDSLSSIAHENTLSDFDFKARVRRFGNAGSANGISMRGVPVPLGADEQWNNSYGFYYNRNGSFTVLKTLNGSYQVLQPWIFNEAIATGDAWNFLRVVAEGPDLFFYINDALVWSGSDHAFTSGQVGLAMYRPFGSSGDLFEVDWATLVGGTPMDLYADDFENPATSKWIQYTLQGTNTWYYPQNANPFGVDPKYTSSGVYNLWGYAQEYAADYTMLWNQWLSLPSSQPIYLHFDHAYDFQSNYDGGVLEYVLFGGIWTDAGPLFTHNGYNGTISSASNPLDGRAGFVQENSGLSSSRLDLTSLGGNDFALRFRIGTNSSGWDWGWYVDDVRIYTCEDKVSRIFLPLTTGGGGTTASGDFHSAFNGNANDWQVHSGDWTVSDAYFTTPNPTGSSSWLSASYTQAFSDITYQVRMKRDGCQTCSNRLLVRGDPDPLGATNDWNSFYSFQYANDGQYSVWKRASGTTIALQGWTPTSAILASDETGDYWNVLKVHASGFNLYFYINDTLVWSGTDTSLNSGKVGVSMYSYTSWSRLYVDWATMKGVVALSPTSVEISPEQKILNEAAGRGGSPEMAP